MMTVRNAAILGSSLLVLSLQGCAQMQGGGDVFGEGASDVATISFFHTNDVYEIDAEEGVGGGMAELMTVLDDLRADRPNSVTTFGGDLFSPSVMSGLTQGAQMVDFYKSPRYRRRRARQSRVRLRAGGRGRAHRRVRVSLARHQCARRGRRSLPWARSPIS